MMIKGGYAGKILRVDLSTGRVKVEDLKEDFAIKYVGGRGFGSIILFRELEPKTDPLGPSNLIIVTPGALTGTAAPAASRTTITFKSPLSNLHGDSASSGLFGANLKYSGYDSLIISGKASNPVYIYIEDDKVEVRDAKKLWGRTTGDTHKLLRDELNIPDLATLTIGQAGEKLVRYASVVTDGGAGVHARCGGGAVFGSKNLKAIVARGHRDLELADPEMFRKTFQEYLDVIAADPYVPPAKKYGTPRFIYHRAKFGIHGAENWQFGAYEWRGVDPELLRSDYSIKAASCPNCPIMCRREFAIRSGRFSGTVSKMEWESIARAITCGVTDAESIIYQTRLANMYGIDAESAGDTIAFAMECYEKGLLTPQDTGGLEIKFKDPDVMLELTRRIAMREGIGDLLAEGTLRAAAKIGKGAERFAMQIKGVEMSAGDPRGMPVRAVSYATGTRGADHLRSNPYIEEIATPQEAKEWFGSEEASDIKGGVKGKGRLVKWSEDFVTIGDLLGLCKFAYYRSATFEYLRRKGIEIATKLYNSITGLNISGEDMMRAGERVFNVEKAFNTREGASRKDDTVPARFFEEPLLGGGPSGGAVVDRDKFQIILDEYYEARGWDISTGLPRLGRLRMLGLEEVAMDLSKSITLKD
ncbi:MAG: aldehyde ferredoxin oxidoreductase family protein [Candidatus Bathyarchaeia archaeon]|nr:aldehyde ferredoxin oxidoreductase family protein [Candidatus Bathyarchaeota archaeon]